MLANVTRTLHPEDVRMSARYAKHCPRTPGRMLRVAFLCHWSGICLTIGWY